MRLATLLLLAACHSSGSSTTPPPVGNAPSVVEGARPTRAPKPPPDCRIVETSAMNASSTTSGAITGGICDVTTGIELAGVTIVATSPALQGPQTAITDETGRFVIGSLPPGVYLVAIYYADVTVEVPNVIVEVDKQSWVKKSIAQQGSDEGIELQH